MDEPPLLQLRGATVRFGADAAIDGVDFRLFPGEVHSLMGENGAGKSTLIKAISGVHPLDEGVMTFEGRDVRFAEPFDAIRAGISTVYQEIDLLPNISVAENIALGREPRKAGRIDWAAMRQDAHEVLADLGLNIDPASVLGTHSVAVQQLVAIARAISADVKVLILDEPTSSLDADEVAELFRVVRSLADRGVAVVFISHFLEQVYELCDRVTVLRDGRLVGEFLIRELLRIDLVQAMLGRAAEQLEQAARAPDADAERPPVVLEARDVSVGRGILSADVDLHEGEVLGVAGLLGSGRTELARALTGIDRLDAGAVRIEGASSPRTPRAAMTLGVVYSSENRRAEGIISDLSVQENIVLALQAQRGAFRKLSPARQRELAASWVEALDVRPPDLDRPAGTLSGGNQQKVLLARWLATASRLLILDEPTRGIDVGAHAEIIGLIRDLCAEGMALLVVSSELEEIVTYADEVVVLRDRAHVARLTGDEVDVPAILAAIAADAPAPAAVPM